MRNRSLALHKESNETKSKEINKYLNRPCSTNTCTHIHPHTSVCRCAFSVLFAFGLISLLHLTNLANNNNSSNNYNNKLRASQKVALSATKDTKTQKKQCRPAAILQVRERRRERESQTKWESDIKRERVGERVLTSLTFHSFAWFYCLYAIIEKSHISW